MPGLAISPESRRIRTLLSGKTTQPVGFRPYFLNPPVQCATTVRGGAVDPEPPVVLMMKRLKSEMTSPISSHKAIYCLPAPNGVPEVQR